MNAPRLAAWIAALGLTAYAALAGPPAAPRTGPVPSIESGLLAAAGPVMDECSKRGYRNIGVLKFAVSKDGKTFPHQVGTLNMHLARRLEPALFLRNARLEEKIGIVRDASGIAAKIDGADHLTPAGRAKLFDAKYPLLWGTGQVTPDAFLTGVATLGQARDTLSIQLYLIDKNLHQTIGEPFDVATRADLLVELGDNYAVPDLTNHQKIDAAAQRHANDPPTVARRAIDDARRKADAAVLGRTTDPNRPHPLADPKAPVRLAIRYDGADQKYEFKDGKAFVAEPGSNVGKVELVLTRTWDAEPLKVVLKVNGVNTLYKQTAPDPHCLGWLLDPADDRTLVVDGYQATGEEAEKFRILSPAESKVNEQRYGADVGTISLSVYREARAMPAPDESDRARQLEIVSKGKPPAENATEPNYNAALDNFMRSAHRGLIGEGERLPNRVIRVTKVWEPTPIMTASVVYYKP